MFPWYSMGLHGGPWGPMGPHEESWVSMGPHGSPWVPMGSHGDWVPTHRFDFDLQPICYRFDFRSTDFDFPIRWQLALTYIKQTKI